MNSILLTVFLGISSLFPIPPQQEITTIIVIRHAEKDPTDASKDPNLSSEGNARAARIAELLSQQEIAAVYATPYKRTIQTVTPLAEEKGLPILEYHPVDPEGFEAMLEKHMGETIVVCGHSNTVPAIIKAFDKDYTIPALEEDEFDKLFLVSRNGSGEASTVKLVL